MSKVSRIFEASTPMREGDTFRNLAGSLGLNLACERLLLGMRARGLTQKSPQRHRTFWDSYIPTHRYTFILNFHRLMGIMFTEVHDAGGLRGRSPLPTVAPETNGAVAVPVVAPAPEAQPTPKA
jgi:hypothetical protein